MQQTKIKKYVVVIHGLSKRFDKFTFFDFKKDADRFMHDANERFYNDYLNSLDKTGRTLERARDYYYKYAEYTNANVYKTIDFINGNVEDFRDFLDSELI